MSKVIFVIFGFVVSLSLFPIQSEDLFMYLALAREYFEKGQFPLKDPFLLAETSSWTIMHQWLSYFIFYGLYLLGGYSAIIMAKVGFIVSILSYPLFLLRKNWVVVFFWGLSVLVGSLAMSFRLVERTSIFSDVFVTLTLGILIKETESPSKWKYLLPPIFLLWVNLHPGFPTGWVLCGLALVASAIKWRTKEFWQLAVVSAGSVLVCLANPRGLQGALYPFAFSQQEGKLFRKLYYEWFPTFDPLFFWNQQTLFILLLICLNLFLIYRARKTLPVYEILASTFIISYGLYAIRFVPTMTYALVLLNTSLALRGTWQDGYKRASVLLAIGAFGWSLKNIFFGYDMISGHREVGLGVDQNIMPVAAAALLKGDQFKGNIFNSHMFGGYLAWSLGENRKIFYHGFVTDTRFYLNEYAGFFRGRELFDVLVARYQIAVFVLDRFAGGEPLIKILVEHPGWTLSYKDSASLIFVKK